MACTACGKCVADAAQGLLVLKNNLPVMDAELLHLQTPEATARCPTGAIVWLDDGSAAHKGKAGARIVRKGALPVGGQDTRV